MSDIYQPSDWYQPAFPELDLNRTRTPTAGKGRSKVSEPKRSVLVKAEEIVNGPRRKSYGHPLSNHKSIARLWQAYLDNKAQFYPGEPLTAQDAGAMMVLLKLARLQFEPSHEDSLLDAVGYLACIEIMNDTEANEDV